MNEARRGVYKEGVFSFFGGVILKKNIKVIATGGTIVSKDTGNGLRPEIGVETVINAAFSGDCSGAQEIRELISKDELRLDVSSLFSIDSSDMRPELWNELGEEIDRLVRGIAAEGENSKGSKDGGSDIVSYDGIVILQGTDTMAYTAGALSAMFNNLPIPVVLTGSQVPIDVSGSDGAQNVCDAVRAVLSLSEKAGDSKILWGCETDCAGADGKIDGDKNNVFIVFAGKLIDGRYATKIDTERFDAFTAVDTKHEMKVEDISCAAEDKSEEYSFLPLSLAEVVLIKVHPGLTSIQLSKMIYNGVDAVLLELFGAGGLPTLYDSLVPVIEKAVEKGVKVFAVSQCLYHKTDLNKYEVGRKLGSAGIIPMGEYSTEYALACARGANKWYKWIVNS